MTQSQSLEFPSLESLSAWSRGRDSAYFIPVKKGKKPVAGMVCILKDNLYYYFRADNGHFSLLATSSKDVFQDE